MEMPFEKVVCTAIEQISAGVQLKIAQGEENRNREFLHGMKELEFYKSNYEKDLKDIIDFWFEIVRLTTTKDNENLDEGTRKRLAKEYDKKMNLDNLSKYQMKTLKYGGTETSKVLALQHILLQEKYKDQPEYTAMYIFCKILSVLKMDILGQELSPQDVMKVLVTDYDDNIEEINKAKNFVEDLYQKQ